MAFVCPLTRRTLRPRVKVFTETQDMVGEFAACQEFVDGLRSKLYIGVGSRSRITHLIRITPDARAVAGVIPRPPRTCTQENLDGWRCWTHTGTAHQWTMSTEHVARAGSAAK